MPNRPQEPAKPLPRPCQLNLCREPSYEEIIRERDRIQTEIDKLDSELFKARTMAVTTHRYADSNWFAAATMAVKQDRRTVQDLARMASEFKKRKNFAQGVSFERQFVYAAKELLDAETYQAIVSLAQERSKA